MSELIKLAKEFGDYLVSKRLKCVTAESCTGGGLAAAITEISGSSAWFDRGFVTYSNESKTEMLGVPKELIDQYGAVSEEVARAMVNGAIERSGADVGISITGIAGPSGGSPEKPVGLVWFAWMCSGSLIAESRIFSGDRQAIRKAALQFALKGAIKGIRLS